MTRNRFHGRGLTLIELLTVIAIVTLLFGLLLPVLSRARGEARAAMCLSHLRQLGAGIHMYAADHDGRLPSSQFDGIWDVLMEPYAPDPEAYWCPSDLDGATTNAAVSYVWRDGLAVIDPAASLSGLNLHVLTGVDVIALFDMIPGWHGNADVQAATLDGSSRRFRYDEFVNNLARPVQ